MQTESYTRQRRQKGLEKLRAQQYYRKNRGKAKLQARKRYRRVRKQPSFKKRQRVRKKKPWLFKRKHAVEDVKGEVLAPTDIAFIHPDSGEMVGLRSVQPLSGMINYQVGPSDFGMIPIDRVMDEADFPSWQDIEDFYDLMDNAYLTDEEDAEFDKIDEADEAEHGGAEEGDAKMARSEQMLRNVIVGYLCKDG